MPVSHESPEDHIGEEMAKFLRQMRDLAIVAFVAMRKRSLSKATMELAVTQTKKMAEAEIAQELAVARTREAIQNKLRDPRNFELERTVKLGRQAAGIEPKGVNLQKARTPVAPSVGQELARQEVIQGVVVERTPGPTDYTPPPVTTSTLERDLEQKSDATRVATDQERAAALARQQELALEQQQKARGLGD